MSVKDLMPVFEVTHDNLVELQPTSFAAQGLRERGDLQRLLRTRIHVVAPGVLIISEEFCDWEDSKRRIDLLGLDKNANLVVIELKRTEDGGHMELQALRYAAMVSEMTFEKAVDVFERYLASQKRSESARDTLLGFLGWSEANEEEFGQDVRIVLASAEFSRELTSTVLWLLDRGLDIRCVRLQPYTDGKRVFVEVQQVLPLPEASQYLVKLKEKREEERQARQRQQSWSGLWFVNIGMDAPDEEPTDEAGHGSIRHWLNCVRYGYVSAGGGRRYSDALKRLKAGDRILAYQGGLGYVGYGLVRRPATPTHEFKLASGMSLEETINPSIRNEEETIDLWEHAIDVEWKKTYELSKAKTFAGVFANPNVVCKLSEPTTVEFARREFEIPV